MSDGRDEYVRKMHSKLDQLNNDIDRLVAGKEQIAENARFEYEKHVADLRQRRDDLQDRLRNLQQASENAVEDIKAGLDLAWEAFAEALRSAKERFK